MRRRVIFMVSSYRAGGPRKSFLPSGRVTSRPAIRLLPSFDIQPVTVMVSFSFSALRGPTGASQCIGRVAFERPVDQLAIVAFHREINVHVRVGPVDLGDHAGECDRLRAIVFGAEGMMGESMWGDEKNASKDQGADIRRPHHRGPPGTQPVYAIVTAFSEQSRCKLLPLARVILNWRTCESKAGQRT